ncbi:MAG TPA: hypothetical protein VK939_03100 [Longimicrobiales bacterium]|nr:hypothetical protein [Longimicrobiales bacterium]
MNLICALVLALQQPSALPPDTVYATPALREFVGRAAAANAAPPPGLENYYARIETELAFVRAEADGREVVLQLEQIASDLHWRRDGGMLQELVGYRSQTLGATFSGLSFFEVPWLVPTLYGDRLDLLRTSEPVRGESGRVRNRRAVHPFATGRDDVYRFSGGDTVDVIRLPDRTIPIVRVRVEPRTQPSRPTLLFTGDVDVDATRLHIVRMQGRLVPSGRRETWGSRLIGAAFAGVLFVRFESGEYDEAYWLPREQRFEVQAISRLGEGRTVFRAISRFVDVYTNDERAERLAADPDTFPYGRFLEPDLGRISGFDDWHLSIGSLVGTATATDFDVYAPPRLVTPRREARVAFGTRYFSQLLRFNRVEGVYTGLGLYAQFGRAAPGLVARAHGGWAWSEQTARGGVELMQRTGPWEWGARAERQLAHTNDFLTSLEPDPGVPPLIGATEYDYVDRRIAGLVVRRHPADSLALRFEVARAGDRNVTRNLQQPGEIVDPDDTSRPNRPAAEGDYWLTRGELHLNPSAGALSLMPGAGLRLAYEGAYGGLEWQRLEAGVSSRIMSGRWTIASRLDGGVLLGPTPPPQALFELGSSVGLPGFSYKAFTGDRAALARGSVGFTLPLLNAPVRLGALYLPAPAPTPAVGIQAGWTEASAATQAMMDTYGWRTSDGVRATLDLRLRLFGGSVSVGAARPLERDADWKFVWGLVAGL